MNRYDGVGDWRRKGKREKGMGNGRGVCRLLRLRLRLCLHLYCVVSDKVKVFIADSSRAEWSRANQIGRTS